MPERKRLIVDIGCGHVPWPLLGRLTVEDRRRASGSALAPGRFTTRELKPGETYMGFDVHRGLLRNARTLTREALQRGWLRGRLLFVRMDVGQPTLPLRSGSVHEVHLHSPHTDPEPDPARLFSEIKRVLRRGGRAYLTIDPFAISSLNFLRYVHGRRFLEELGLKVERRTTRPEEYTRYTLYPRPFTFHLVLRKR